VTKAKHPPHDSAITHVAGTSEFIDDRPEYSAELLVGVVGSPVAFGKIKKLDLSACLKVPGVVAVFTAADIPHNLWGTIFQDQPILAGDTVQYHSEAVALIAAENTEALREARRLVQIKIDALNPILSIKAAIEKKSFTAPSRFIERGDVRNAIEKSPHKRKAVLEIAGQEHFYLEVQSCVAYPGEQGQIHVYSSTQHPTEVQHSVAHSLGLKFSDVICTVKRMGGAFGGKESQATPFAVMAALVAQRCKRPARLVLTRDEDMQMTGKRNPFECHYEVGFAKDGTLLGLDVKLYSNSGAYADLSTSIMERAMLHVDNAYYIPAVKIEGQVCKTHMVPTTAFRGFGGPKGVALIEGIMEDIAQELGIDSLDVRKANVYRADNNRTPYGQIVSPEVLPKLFSELEKKCEYRERRKEVEKFNGSCVTHVKGLSLTAVKFGIAFTTRFLNKASALVNLQLDGTVQVSTGATEMGQGVNTKIAQVVAEVFSIPVGDVRIMPTSTEKNHNTSPTAASSGADLNGAAARVAALEIKQRLEQAARFYFSLDPKMRGKMPSVLGVKDEARLTKDSANSTDTLPANSEVIFENSEVYIKGKTERADFLQIVEEAFFSRVNLGAYGFYTYDGIHFNKETGQGDPFYYFTNGVACSEVLIDRFTGELKVQRSDILMDLGRPLNEGIDQGQVSGGFVQGVGWLTTERLAYSEKGELLTHAPSTYKIPSIHDIPRVFNMDFWVNDLNEKNLRGSKAVGEPPLLLGISVWTAVKNALSFVDGAKPKDLRIPASQEEILMLMSNL
jgi:xanthine dehydrogenase large subunit